MQSFGKTLQLIALLVLPVAILMEISGALGREHGVSQMLIMLGFGVAVFWVGRLLEGYSGS